MIHHSLESQEWAVDVYYMYWDIQEEENDYRMHIIVFNHVLEIISMWILTEIINKKFKKWMCITV